MRAKRAGAALDAALVQAVGLLRQGKIVAFPTETYYGLAVDPDCPAAVANLYAVKGRPADKPLLLLIDEIAQLGTIAREIPPVYGELMARYWPGPLTLVFPAIGSINHMLTGYSGTIGVRVSPHPVARELVRRMGKPITATSANLSGLTPARTAAEVAAMLGNKIDFIVDGGPTPGGLSSTVVGVDRGRLVLLRPGQLDLTEWLEAGS